MLIIYSNLTIRKFPAQKFWLVAKLVSAYPITFVLFFNKYRCAMFVVVFEI